MFRHLNMGYGLLHFAKKMGLQWLTYDEFILLKEWLEQLLRSQKSFTKYLMI